MIQNSVKHEIDHVVNLALFRHRGDIYATATETGVPVEYVQRLFYKLKKRREKDVSYWIASNVMQRMYEGYQQRTTFLQKYLTLLSGNEGVEVSACCKSTITKEIIKNKVVPCCDRCELPCDIRTIPQNQTYDLFIKLITQLREEDRLLVDFADDLGFTNKETPPTIKQNILVVDNHSIHIDPNVAKELDELSPIQREKTRKRLESLIIDSAKKKEINE